jgi:hypothetical protein
MVYAWVVLVIIDFQLPLMLMICGRDFTEWHTEFFTEFPGRWDGRR